MDRTSTAIEEPWAAPLADSLRQPLADSLAEPLGGIAAALAVGERLIVIPVDDDRDAKAAAGAATMAACVDNETRVLLVGNPLRSPLTIHRILFQLDVNGGDTREADEDAALREACAPASPGGTTVLVVEQAQSLHPEALEKLMSLAGLRLILVGRPAWLASADAVEMAHMPAAEYASAAPSPGRQVMRLAAPPSPPASLIVRQPGRRMRQRTTWLLLPIVAAGAFAAYLSTPQWHSGVPAPTPLPSPPAAQASAPLASTPLASTPLASTPLAPVPQASASPVSALPVPVPVSPEPVRPSPILAAPLPPAPAPTPAPTEEAKLRADFESFLARALPAAQRLTARERGALFRQYLDWRATGGIAANAPPAPPVALPEQTSQMR